MSQNRSSEKDLAREISRLGDLTREDLVQQWIREHGQPPPKGISRRLLEFSAAYSLQAKVFGGLKASSKNALAAALDPASKSSGSVAGAMSPQPGSQLVRTWNGRTHHVEVLEKGFIWNGKHFQSLSAVAREITSTRWSGPRFFGL